MLQILVNALISAAMLAPPAIAFTLLFSILRFPNFAVGSYITVGSYAALVANMAGAPMAVAVPVAMAVTAILFWLADVAVFRPLQGHADVTLLVVSIALSFIVESAVRLAFGSSVRGYDIPLARPHEWAGVRITSDQVAMLLGAAAILLAAHIVLRYVPAGKAIRAVADNPALAEARGIDTQRINRLVWLFGGALVGFSGVVAGMELVIEPAVGAKLIIPVFAAAIVGGIGSPTGAVAGALLVSVAEEVALLVLPSAYKPAVGFVLIAVTLVVRPHGLMGRPSIRK